MLLCATSYALLRAALLSANDADAPIVRASSGGWTEWKGVATLIAYLLAIAIVFLSPAVAILIYIAVAALWLIPNKRLEQFIE